MRDVGKQRNSTEPKGELASRTLAMPADSNPKGDIFGGWIMSLMDSAGKMSATPHAGGRVVTVAVSNITFLQPVHVGDTVCCYTDVKRLGRTSIRTGADAVPIAAYNSCGEIEIWPSISAHSSRRELRRTWTGAA